jgi:hypothetical protein
MASSTPIGSSSTAVISSRPFERWGSRGIVEGGAGPI